MDLAGAALSQLRAPILMIVGGADPDTVRWNRSAIRQLRGDVTLKIVRRAGHTFEEAGAIGTVGRHAIAWLNRRSAPSTANESAAGGWSRAIRSLVVQVLTIGKSDRGRVVQRYAGAPSRTGLYE